MLIRGVEGFFCYWGSGLNNISNMKPCLLFFWGGGGGWVGEGSLGGSWGLSKWVNNADNWCYYMTYRGY